MNTDRLPCGVLEISKERVILQCNQYALKTLGLSADTAAGQRIENIVSTASKIFVDSYVYPLLHENAHAEELQLVLKSEGGRNVPIVANIILEDDGSSVWTFMPCVNRDKLYEELLSTRDKLSDNAKELAGLNNQISLEHEDMKVFTQSLSHDFRAPIRRARQFIEIVTEDLVDMNLDIDDELKMLNTVKQNMDSLITLIDGLLEFLIADADEPKRDLVDLNEVVNQAIALSEGQCESSVTINKDALPTIAGSSAQLQVLFKNLIGNAIKYTEKPPMIRITGDTDVLRNHYTITIKDNGIGMSPEHLKKIFEPFSRLHSENEFSGSGLGLSIVRKLVAKHQGEITVQSTPGEGSSFCLTFPIADMENSNQQPTSNSTNTGHQTP